jgi:uncharacterized caspase-like protein
MSRKIIAALFVLAPLLLALTPSRVPAQTGAPAEKRIALVVGNAGYQVGALNTPANDAGLIAQTLQAAGFDVVGARDLDQDSLRRAFRDFVEKANGAGPDTVAFIYMSGYGLQLEGENYFVPIDAKIARDSDVPAEALRLSDYTRPLAALKLKASIVVLDAARANPFAQSGQPLAGGLALVDPEPGLLIAYNAAPGTVAPEGQGPYGPYAQALAEMIREGGLPLPQVFEKTRLRVNDLTKGGEVPWHANKITTQVAFFERAPDAPPPAVSAEETAAIRAKPIKSFTVQDAYAAAVERDSLDGYSEFVTAYPRDPLAARVRVIIAARREAIIWRRSRIEDTPPAYWSYLRRYPDGPHAWDARRRLAFLAAALEPPPTFAVLAYDVPPPPPEEIVYIRRPVLYFDDPEFAFAPPPPPPVFFLGPPAFVVVAPPPAPIGLFVLPMPAYTPVPVWVRPPVYVAAPPANNVIFANVHNTVVINNVTNTVTVTNPAGQTRTITPAAAAAVPGAPPGVKPAAAASFAPALPPSVAQKAALAPAAGTPGAATPAAATPTQPGQPLPGMKGQPLPAAKGTTPTAAPTATLAPGAATPAPATGPKPGTPPAAAKLTTPSAITGTTTTPPPGGTPKGTTVTPAAKLTTTPHPAAATANPTPTPGPGIGTSTPKAHTPPAAAKLTTTPPPATTIKPATPPAATLAPPSPPKPPSPPPAVAAKPAPTFHPAAAAPPPPPVPPKPPGPPPQAQAKGGCPPGKSMAMVNGHPQCK